LGSQSHDGYRTGWVIFALVVIAAAIASLAIFALPFEGPPSAGNHPYSFFFGWWFFVPLLFFAFFLFFFSRWWGWGWGYRRGYYQYYDPALETLRGRFARGEITREQYDQMRRDLEQTR